MIWLILLLVPAGLLTIGFFITDINNWNRYNDIVRRREADPAGLHLPDDRLRENIFSQWLFVKFLGIHWGIGRYFGNCFTPAVVLEVSKSKWLGKQAKLVLTFRTKTHRETRFYFALSRRPIRWHSDHIAARFGKPVEAPFGTFMQYRGILGRHDQL